MVISWDEYFMGVAILSSMRSKDPKCQVGACIVNGQKKIVSLGYNGMPYSKQDNDQTYPWTKNADPIKHKHTYVVHAELNAILNAHADIRGCTLYATLFPCHECCKAIVQSGITELVYITQKDDADNLVKASELMLANAGIICRQYSPSGKNIELKL